MICLFYSGTKRINICWLQWKLELLVEEEVINLFLWYEGEKIEKSRFTFAQLMLPSWFFVLGNARKFQ